ncbi:hypothetical protein ACIA5D_09430 [Actinoplanes sp. NPDC051513]|uniref:hypothetical protein n=1 Tax=Actinoplanes sp. NPDC051513 TaxID=3363908 RepID=UPI003788C5E1
MDAPPRCRGRGAIRLLVGAVPQVTATLLLPGVPGAAITSHRTGTDNGCDAS